jgi:hypothetical protein
VIIGDDDPDCLAVGRRVSHVAPRPGSLFPTLEPS